MLRPDQAGDVLPLSIYPDLIGITSVLSAGIVRISVDDCKPDFSSEPHSGRKSGLAGVAGSKGQISH
jgi:hypothetical protein